MNLRINGWFNGEMIWLVLWNMTGLWLLPYIGNNNPNWRTKLTNSIKFSEGLIYHQPEKNKHKNMIKHHQLDDNMIKHQHCEQELDIATNL